jgi:uncharacterized protein
VGFLLLAPISKTEKSLLFSLTMKTIGAILSFEMKNLDEIRTLLIEQREEFLTKDLGVERTKLSDLVSYKDAPFSVIISGLRRAGKSTLLAQMARRLYPKNDYFYVNFEDERFISFTVEDFTKLHELLITLFGNYKTFIFDEIQNIEGWERFVRRMEESGYKFYITGSNASLLSKELGTRLTGQYIPVELLPFSFEEFLRFKQIDVPNLLRITTVQRGVVKQALAEYIQKGGIPAALRYPEIPWHKTLYDDIINRDIAARYKITDTKELRELSFNLLSNISKLFSFNKMKELLKLGSVNTVSNYVDRLEKAWLLLVLNKYAYSVKEQQIANKKIYAIDTGLVKTVAFSFSEDKGRFLENIVFLELLRRHEDIYYYKTTKDKEIDFYLPKKKLFVQVCLSVFDKDTKERECRALREAGEEVKGSEFLLLTEDEKDIISYEGIKIQVLPLYEWLLQVKGK